MSDDDDVKERFFRERRLLRVMTPDHCELVEHSERCVLSHSG